MADELDWFSGFYKGVINGNNVAMVAELDSKVVNFCEVRCSLPNSEASHRGGLGLAIIKEHRGKGMGKAFAG